MKRSRVPDSAYTFFELCDICNKPDAGRGQTENGAKTSLGKHKRTMHGIVSGSGRHLTSEHASSILDALGPCLEKWGAIR
jgi:hypothetical protein